MESKTKNRKTREQVARMVERAFNGLTLAPGEDAVSELKEGWFNAAYNVRLADGREVILKIAPPKDAEILAYEKNIMATEVASMRLAAQNPAIPVPEIYYFDNARDLCDSDYFFMEKLGGENYDHVKKNLPPAIQTQIATQDDAVRAAQELAVLEAATADHKAQLKAWVERNGPVVIGDGVKVGAEAVIINRDVPAGCSVVGAPAYIVKRGDQHVHEPLPVSQYHLEDKEEAKAKGATGA